MYVHLLCLLIPVPANMAVEPHSATELPILPTLARNDPVSSLKKSPQPPRDGTREDMLWKMKPDPHPPFAPHPVYPSVRLPNQSSRNALVQAL